MPNKKKFSAAAKKEFREALLARRASLLGDVNHQENEAIDKSRLGASGDLSAFPFHMADVGTDNFNHDFTLGLIENEELELHEIDEALKRLQDGTYGICEACQKSIRRARLRALPYARFCIECKREQESEPAQ
ncbi:MAG: TraR/DksA family transcriptional regulator [Alphaproteobacteria bacterium]